MAVFPDGQSFYLNKPGASFQDFVQTTSQMLQYIPGASTALKKQEVIMLKEVYILLVQEVELIVQDLATIPLDQKKA